MNDKRETLVEALAVVRHDVEYHHGVFGLEVERFRRPKGWSISGRLCRFGLRATSDLCEGMTMTQTGKLQDTGRFELLRRRLFCQ